MSRNHRYLLVTDTISKNRYLKCRNDDTNIINIGDISRHFPHIDPPLFWFIITELTTGTERTDGQTDGRTEET